MSSILKQQTLLYIVLYFKYNEYENLPLFLLNSLFCYYYHVEVVADIDKEERGNLISVFNPQLSTDYNWQESLYTKLKITHWNIYNYNQNGKFFKTIEILKYLNTSQIVGHSVILYWISLYLPMKFEGRTPITQSGIMKMIPETKIVYNVYSVGVALEEVTIELFILILTRRDINGF